MGPAVRHDAGTGRAACARRRRPHQLEAALLNLARLLANVVPGAGSNDLLSRDTLHILGLEDEKVLSRLRREAVDIPAWLPDALGLGETPVAPPRS